MDQPSVRHSVWLVFFLLLNLVPVTSFAGQASEPGADWLAVQQASDGRITTDTTRATSIQATSEAVLALTGQAPQPVLAQALDYLNQADADTSTENLARRLLASRVLGTTENAALQTLLQRHKRFAGFAPFPGYDSDVLSSAFALQALAAHGIVDERSGSTLQFLLSRQQADGGWGPGDNLSQVQTTALAMHAIWQYRRHYAVGSALTSAQDYLLASRDTDHLWGDDERSSLALIALLEGMLDRTPLLASVAALRERQSSAGDIGLDAYLTALALRVFALSAQPNADETRLFGRIQDESSGQGLPGVEITLSGAGSASAATDAEGRFLINDLAPGLYEIRITREGYGTLLLSTLLQQGDKRDLGNVLLAAQVTNPDTGEPVTTGTVRGHITNQRTGEPVAGAAISIAGTTPGVFSASDGSYLLTGVEPGALSLVVSAPGYRNVTGTATLSAGQTLVFSPALPEVIEEKVTLSGTVSVQATGAAVANATVTVTQGAHQWSTQTDAAGHYALTDLSPGELSIVVTADGFQSATATANAPAGVRIAFSPGLLGLDEEPGAPGLGGLRGVVVDAISGRGLPGAVISLDYGDGSTAYHTQTDEDGDFLLEALPPGPASLLISADEYESLTGTLTIQAGLQGDIGQVDLMPEAQATDANASGRVIDVRTGDAIAGALVRARHQSSLVLREALTDIDGLFELTGLAAGEHAVNVSAPGYQDSEFALVAYSGDRLALGDVRLRLPGLDALLPDIAVQQLDVAALHSDARTFELEGAIGVTVVNRGNAAVSTPFTVIAFEDLDRDGLFDPAVDTLLGEHRVRVAIEVDGRHTFSVPVAGQQSFRDAPVSVLLDAEQALVELSRANNLQSTAGLCGGTQKPYLDLGLCLDGSGSVSVAQFALQLEGTARAIENPDIVPRDGSVRMSLLQFNSNSFVEI